MGGRGSSYGISVIEAVSKFKKGGKVRPLNVAGMTPTDRGSRFTNEKKTLKYIENKKMEIKTEQLQVIDDYGYVTKAFQGDEHSVTVDMGTINYMKDKTVTHNHPAAFGGTFSDADIYTLRYGMKELRASAKEGTYVMRARHGADPEGFMNAYSHSASDLQNKMRRIAKEVARKKWPSYEVFEKENRKSQLKVLDMWYNENASAYGYDYIFEENSDYR